MSSNLFKMLPTNYSFTNHTNRHIYKLADRSRRWPEAPFSIASILKCRRGRYSFPLIAPLTLGPHLIMLSVKQGGIKYHFFFKSLVWFDSGLHPGLPDHWRSLYRCANLDNLKGLICDKVQPTNINFRHIAKVPVIISLSFIKYPLTYHYTSFNFSITYFYATKLNAEPKRLSGKRLNYFCYIIYITFDITCRIYYVKAFILILINCPAEWPNRFKNTATQALVAVN